MGICFVEVDPLYIKEAYPSYFHEQARYFKATKDGKPLCFYGVITRAPGVGEAFLMMQTFNGKVLSKGFFTCLFAHVFSLGYKEIWTWTKWDRLIKLFRHFKRFGIEKTGYPPWNHKSKIDPRQTKTWFIKKVTQRD